MNIIDLRSDTVTKPGPEMRAAIANAEVGDDVLGDDPTIMKLEARAADLLGMPAAVYTPSGTLANQLAIRSVCEPGDELILDELTHCYIYETGGPAAISGVSYRFVRSHRGVYRGSDVAALVRPPSIHFARSRMVIVENSNNRGGGAVWPVESVADVASTAHNADLHVHIDGARIMNACVAKHVNPRDYTQHADTVSMCFSKGLGAPVGSVLAGSIELIQRARRFRKMFGGAMRQAGLLAAGALYALDHHVERLAEDHANAKRLAAGLAQLPNIQLDPDAVETNIVIFDVDPAWGTAPAFAQQLRERGVWCLTEGEQRVRFVTHLDVNATQIDAAVGVCEELLASPTPAHA